MKLIHTADLHLGAQNTAKLPLHLAERRREELLDTFAAIAALAEREGAAVLIAGDLFDTTPPQERALSAFLDTVRHYAGVRFFCLPGNHDGGRFPKVALPENLTVFLGEIDCFSVGDTDIYGISPEGDFPYDQLRPDPARHNIVVAHGTVREGGAPAEGAIVLSRLAGRGIDYLALGHFHSMRIGRLDERGIFAYSGTPEGRGMDEAGECGVLLVDTDVTPKEPRFIKTAKRTIHRLTVELSEGEADLFSVAGRITEAVSGIPEGDIVRIELVGKLPPEAKRPPVLRLTARFADRFFYFEVKDKTGTAIRPEDFCDSLTLKGEFVRRVLAADLSTEERDAILRMGLAALRGEGDEI